MSTKAEDTKGTTRERIRHSGIGPVDVRAAGLDSAEGRTRARRGIMEFVWDEAKRLANTTKHELDFREAVLVFGGRGFDGPARAEGGEERRMLVGVLRGRYVTIIYTLRGDAVRVISMRRARDVERRGHQAPHGR